MTTFDAEENMETIGIDIAVVGMSCRFPGARTIEEYWKNLCDGVESISFFSDEELRAAGVNESELRRPDYVKATAVLRDVDLFDANFFGFSPRDAELMDPQQRLFLECAWEALERAGYIPETYPGAIGVYAGSGINTYLLNNILSNPELAGSLNPYQFIIHNDKDFLATRVSYKLNLKGPGIGIQTACSTSLVAVHLACQSLLSYQCDVALAGGVTIRIPEIKGYVYHEGGVASPDGHCRAFDAQAQGVIGGNGVGIVVLKRLDEALADGDNICAVIKGSAINNDGAQKVGFTAPSVDGQAEVIEAAQAIAGIDPETITYIETHGTGTALGDPIEVAALTQAFRTRTEKKGFCAIGSVKTNIGHLDTAAGVAGLIKSVLSLQHAQLPPSLHFTSPNPAIDFDGSPFYVNASLAEWKANAAAPRRAAVSSFGMGGTNAHVILEEAPAVQPSGDARPYQLISLSARTDTALDVVTANLAQHLEQTVCGNLADVAYTLHTGRKAFSHRRVVVCRGMQEAARALAERNPQQLFTGVCAEKSPEIVFMFPGQGSQYVNMARGLYEQEAPFRLEIDRCAELLKSDLGFDLRTVLYPGSAELELEEATRRINQTAVAQAALFVVEYATAKLWMSWGVRPQAMVGHSLGEYVAAHLAGVFTLEDALHLVALRGRLMQQLPTGLMLAIPLAAAEVRPLLSEGLSLAGINAPAHCVVSGEAQAVESFARQMLERDIECRRLQTSHAFHSAMMEPALPDFTAAVSKLKLSSPRIPYLSNLTGTWIKPEEATSPVYWAQHLRQPVRFSENLRELLKQQDQLLLEVGPGRTLSTLARRHFATANERTVLNSLRHPEQTTSDLALLLETLGKLWLAGVAPDWHGFYGTQKRLRVSLPTYPFERQRYWIAPADKTEATPLRSTTLQRNPNVQDWFYLPVWKQTLPPAMPDLIELQRWLVFLDECGVGARVAYGLKQKSLDVVTVQSGEHFRQLDEQAYEINPRRRSDYESLFKELQTRDKFPHGIAHLWAVTPDEGQASEGGDFAELQDAGFNSLLYLTQSLDDLKLTAPLHLCALSNDMQMVTGEESLRPEKATLTGLCLVIPQEYPHITCRSVDVSLRHLTGDGRDRLCVYLTAELLSQNSETMVAYRGLQKWARSFEPLMVETKAGAGLKQGGAYLITGGLGNIGLLLASHLASTVRAKLVLVSRSALPAREDWEQWLTTATPEDSVSQKLRAIRAMEACGAEVLIAQADVADKQQMQAMMLEACERFGDFDGVIHAAGLVGESWLKPIRETDTHLLEAHLRPKAHGLMVLDQLLEGKKVDFCLLVSSLSAIIGGAGYAAYAAANLFMDALAHRRNLKGGVPWMSANWDGWQTQFEGDVESLPASRFGMVAHEGLKAFETLLPLIPLTPQLVISTGDLTARVNQLVKRERASAVSTALTIEDAAAAYPRTGMQHQYVAPGDELERGIAQVWAEALGVGQVGIHDSFFELGGDSLLATQILPRLRENVQVDLTLRNFFEVPTVAGLASLITRLREEQQAAQETEILKMLDLLSEEELEAELNKRMQITES